MHPAHVYNDTRMICREADRRSCFAQHTSFYIDILYSTNTRKHTIYFMEGSNWRLRAGNSRYVIYVCADVQMLGRSVESSVRQ
ncbi:hypothetical protein ALC60_01584 [Trachymyrmex zeteki]|uniref:Uncharacterized protein n=1 Tax=Mycetomoellerius zeteki TaxID=64791 RepID=A0A151XGH7_9HYME|nr:hypothetical protein ALC60_01584 [Trachymyrmex zeteki]